MEENELIELCVNCKEKPIKNHSYGTCEDDLCTDAIKTLRDKVRNIRNRTSRKKRRKKKLGMSLTIKLTEEEKKEFLSHMGKQQDTTPFKVTRANFAKALLLKCVQDEILY